MGFVEGVITGFFGLVTLMFFVWFLDEGLPKIKSKREERRREKKARKIARLTHACQRAKAYIWNMGHDGPGMDVYEELREALDED